MSTPDFGEAKREAARLQKQVDMERGLNPPRPSRPDEQDANRPPQPPEGASETKTPRYPNHPCHWWPNKTADDATEDEIEIVHKIAGDPMDIDGMKWEQARENYAACAHHIRKYVRERLIALTTERDALMQTTIKYQSEQQELLAELTAAEERVKQQQIALHRCLAATGEEAGDIDDFRALLDREAITVSAVEELRRENNRLEKEVEEAKRGANRT